LLVIESKRGFLSRFAGSNGSELALGIKSLLDDAKEWSIMRRVWRLHQCRLWCRIQVVEATVSSRAFSELSAIWSTFPNSAVAKKKTKARILLDLIPASPAEPEQREQK
jgi:hypothetical protein